MSIFAETGLSINITAPLWRSSVGYGEWVTDRTQSYTHEIRADGGFWSASIGLGADQTYIEDWIENGLGRTITVDDSGDVIFHGFVNQISARIGILNMVYGPLLDIRNRVYVTFAPTDYSTEPPIRGDETITDAGNNTTSQSRYGILIGIENGSELVDMAEAESYRDRILDERAYPPSSDDVSAAGQTSLTLDVTGFVHLLQYPYTNAAATGTINASTKLANIIAANPNIAYIPFDTTYIDTNVLQVGDLSEGYDTALTIIQRDIVSLGDTTQNRWTFGVYENLCCHYHVAPTDIAYNQQIAEQAIMFESGEGAVSPWRVRPARWVFRTDYLVGRTFPTDDFRQDPRYRFIESVTYTAPHGLQARGGKTDTLPQLLAQLGVRR